MLCNRVRALVSTVQGKSIIHRLLNEAFNHDNLRRLKRRNSCEGRQVTGNILLRLTMQ
jgi:hypothetical protein